VFAETVYVSVPLPVLPEPTDIHATALVAPHVQPAPALTETVALPPFEPMLAVVGVTVYVQPFACATVKVAPPTVSVALRAGPVFAVAV
jgi:hypothetical protein